jgi:hypothetical protein
LSCQPKPGKIIDRLIADRPIQKSLDLCMDTAQLITPGYDSSGSENCGTLAFRDLVRRAVPPVRKGVSDNIFLTIPVVYYIFISTAQWRTETVSD